MTYRYTDGAIGGLGKIHLLIFLKIYRRVVLEKLS